MNIHLWLVVAGLVGLVNSKGEKKLRAAATKACENKGEDPIVFYKRMTYIGPKMAAYDTNAGPKACMKTCQMKKSCAAANFYQPNKCDMFGKFNSKLAKKAEGNLLFVKDCQQKRKSPPVKRKLCQTLGRRGTDYSGRVAVTKSGKTCQRWDSQTPHKHEQSTDKMAEKTLAEAENFCRNPDGEKSVWCYTTDPQTRWEYCDVKRCPKQACRNDGKDPIIHHPGRLSKNRSYASKTIWLPFKCEEACSKDSRCAAATHLLGKCRFMERFSPKKLFPMLGHKVFVKDCRTARQIKKAAKFKAAMRPRGPPETPKAKSGGASGGAPGPATSGGAPAPSNSGGAPGTGTAAAGGPPGAPRRGSKNTGAPGAPKMTANTVDKSKKTKTNLFMKKRPAQDKVCFPEDGIGCFHIGVSPFNRLGEVLPQSATSMDVTVNYHAQHLGKPITIVKHQTEPILKSAFDKSKQTKIIVHGYYENADLAWIKSMSNRYVRLGDYNVFVVSWPKHGRLLEQAAADTRVVAAMLHKLMKKLDVSAEKIHCIGHNMGAHICGDLGTRMGRINRISGLDPKGAPFDENGPEQRLDSKDAWYVDVIHTDGLRLTNQDAYGTFKQMGHVDFYVNGGAVQPGCHRTNDGVLRAHPMNCDSARAAYYYLYSMYQNRCGFVSIPCQKYSHFKNGICSSCGRQGCLRMGEWAWEKTARNVSTPVKYFLKTEPNAGHGYQRECLEPYVLTFRDNEPTPATARVWLYGKHGQTVDMKVEKGKSKHIVWSVSEVGEPKSMIIVFEVAVKTAPKQVTLTYFKAYETRVMMKLRSSADQKRFFYAVENPEDVDF